MTRYLTCSVVQQMIAVLQTQLSYICFKTFPRFGPKKTNQQIIMESSSMYGLCRIAMLHVLGLSQLEPLASRTGTS